MTKKSLRSYRVTIAEQRLFTVLITEHNPRDARRLALQLFENRHQMTDIFTAVDHRVHVAATADLGKSVDDDSTADHSARKERP